MKIKGWHGLLLGFGAGLVVCHVYHTKTSAPGTVRSKQAGGY